MFDDPKEASVSEKAHDAHSNEDSGVSWSLLVLLVSKFSDCNLSAASSVKIAKFSGNSVNEGGPISVTYHENVTNLQLCF
jgi:hypothetical protein